MAYELYVNKLNKNIWIVENTRKIQFCFFLVHILSQKIVELELLNRSDIGVALKCTGSFIINIHIE